MKLHKHLLALVALAILASCSVSNDVATGRSIQKRKYNDGYYFSFGKLFNRTADAMDADDIALLEERTAEEGMNRVEEIPAETASLVTPADEIEVPEQGVEHPAIAEPVITPETITGITSPLDISKNPGTTRRGEKTLPKIGRIYGHDTIFTKISSGAQSPEGVLMLILLIILCFIIPPVAVAVVDGISTRFWIDLIFFLIGWGVGIWLFGGGLAYLCALVAVIYALLIVLAVI